MKGYLPQLTPVACNEETVTVTIDGHTLYLVVMCQMYTTLTLSFYLEIISPLFPLLQVIAYDRGTPSLTGTTTVNVAITDINNKKPTFSVPSQSVHISESTPVGTVFSTYPATDLDETASLEYFLLLDETIGEDEDKVPVTDAAYLQVCYLS